MDNTVIKNNKRILHLSVLTALTITAFYFESLIPKFLPFMRLGLANIFIVVLLYNRQFTASAIILFGKIIIGNFFTGLIFSPVVLISFGGSFLAYILMSFFLLLRVKFSIIGVSILGAFGHNLGQILIVRLFIIKDDTIFNFFPLLILLALISGLITGYISYKIDQKLDKSFIKIFE